MTLRSPKQPSKSTTISRRIRNRNDQNLSVQPPAPAPLRNQRSHRAVTVSSGRHISGNYSSEEPQPPVWHPTEDIVHFPRSNTLLPSGLEHNQPSSLLLSQPLNLSPLQSPQRSPTDIAPISSAAKLSNFNVQQTVSSDVIPTPLPPGTENPAVVDFDFRLSPEPEHPQGHVVELQDMSTLDFMMPSHYGGHYPLPPLHSTGYPELNQPPYPESRTSQPSTSAADAYVPSYSTHNTVQDDQLSQEPYAGSRTSQPPASEPYVPSTSENYVSSYASNPGVQEDPRRSAELLPSFRPSPDARSPYQQTLDPIRVNTIPSQVSPPIHPVPVSHSYTYPPMNPISNANVSAAHYPPASIYAPGYHVHPSYTSSSPSYNSALAPPIAGATLPASPSAQGSGNAVRVLSPQRQKPQCWDHGCNGRAFSTFSNLLRHQREKSGTAAKAYCPRCGAEFTRTTARNGHMAHEKCKPRRTSDSSSNK